MPNATGAVLLGGDDTQPRRWRPSMVQVREFQHEQWRLWALGDYVALLTRLIRRSPEDSNLYDRVERAIAEAERTQAHLDEMTDALA
jgi:hypothetical protein